MLKNYGKDELKISLGPKFCHYFLFYSRHVTFYFDPFFSPYSLICSAEVGKSTTKSLDWMCTCKLLSKLASLPEYTIADSSPLLT